MTLPILLIDQQTTMGAMLHHSLAAEGLSVTSLKGHTPDAVSNGVPQALAQTAARLVIINGIDQPAGWLAQMERLCQSTPTISLSAQPPPNAVPTKPRLQFPFAMQDLLHLVQERIDTSPTTNDDLLAQLSTPMMHQIDDILAQLHQSLRARCVILSAASGWLITRQGQVDASSANSLAALLSASFSATAQAAQMLGSNEMFDSNLQESEGYGLYAIQMHQSLILSVAFSDNTTVGLVRHQTAQAALDILDLLVGSDIPSDAWPQQRVEITPQQISKALKNLFETPVTDT